MNPTGLLAALSVAPSFPDAACRGYHWLYDMTIPAGGGPAPAEVRQARRDCIETCAACPELEPCRQWLQSLPRADRPEGVVAGLVVTRRTDLKETA